ncbi:MAG: inositol monophosphatase [Planctomycetes bacterium]|nr:inositol monophosphatase [Planctomycetota bacterium]
MKEIIEFLDPLRRLHDNIRARVVTACEQQAAIDLARVAHEGADDVTYEVDRISESALVEWFTREIATHEPIVLIGEGLPDGRVVLPNNAVEADARWRVIVDPIDGTRGLMYQKRPAWILTGVAPNSPSPRRGGAGARLPSPARGGAGGGGQHPSPHRGGAGGGASLADIELAVQTEIPLVKQHLCDQLWATRGKGAHGVRINRLTNESQPLAIQPSTATDLRHGYATICRFFPGGRDVLAAIDDALCDRLLARRGLAQFAAGTIAATGTIRRGWSAEQNVPVPLSPADSAAVFEDQYACTSGQLYGLATGQDRFVADLRPLVQPLIAARGKTPGHCCHAYDLCTKLIAEEAGVIITSPTGRQVQTPLDTETNVAWIGYANRHLRAQIEPVLRDLLQEFNLTNPLSQRDQQNPPPY